MKLRITRHVNDLKEMKGFYVDLLGLKVINSFKDHNHYDGLILGDKEGCWELEFTTSEEPSNHLSSEDDLIVLYIDEEKKYNEIIRKFNELRIIEFAPRNPFWEQNGKLYKDPEGNRVLIVKRG